MRRQSACPLSRLSHLSRLSRVATAAMVALAALALAAGLTFYAGIPIYGIIRHCFHPPSAHEETTWTTTAKRHWELR